MKKTITLLFALTVSLAGSAMTSQIAAPLKSLGSQTTVAVSKGAPLMKAASEKAISRAGNDLSDLPLISEVPGATTALYSRNDIYIGVDYDGQMMMGPDYGLAAEVATLGDKVYFKNPFSGIETNSYLEGTREGNIVTVTFPQQIYQETYVDWEADLEGNVMKTDHYYAYKMTVTRGEESTRIELAPEQTARFEVTEDGYELIGDEFIGMVLAQTVDNNGTPETQIMFAKMADTRMVYTRVTDEIAEIPAAAGMQLWVMSVAGENSLVSVGIDGSDIYISGFIDTLPAGVIKGKIEGDKAVFANNQYLGIDARTAHLAYLEGATYVTNEETWEDEFSMLPNLTFNYDSEARTLTLDAGHSMTISTIKDAIFLMYAFNEVEFKWQDMSTPMTPQTPEIDSCSPLGYMPGYGLIFYLAANSTDGRVLDPKNLYYNIYFDDQLLTLYPDEYTGLTVDEMTDIPYEYEDFASGIYVFGDEHDMMIYSEGFAKIGVRALYKNHDGSIAYSPIAYLDLSGVDSAVVEKDVESIEFFDLAGRRVASEAKGLVLRRTVFSDGTSRTEKIVK